MKSNIDLLTVVFIGRSGCGKGTQVSELEKYVKEHDDRSIFHLESGSRFRSFIKEGSYASKISNAINEQGGLQPEFLSIWAWGGEIVRNLDPQEHLFIDGTPRRVSEAKILESMFGFFDRKKVHIVYLNVSEEWAMERAKERGRSDDVELSDIKARMKWFNTDVVSVLDYYRGHREHTFHEINGEQPIEKVHADVVRSLGI